MIRSTQAETESSPDDDIMIDGKMEETPTSQQRQAGFKCHASDVL
jgi:hypothetical protein